jgi:hypothetical protein
MRGIDLLASPFAGVTCRGHALTYTPLCYEGGRRVRRDFRSEGLGSIAAVIPIAMEVWTSSW